MTATSNINAGSRITAAGIQGTAPLAAYKPTDQSFVAQTAYQNDSALFIPMAAAASYALEAFIIYEGGALNASDFKFQFAGPAGFGMNLAVVYNNTAGALALSSTFGGAGVVAGTAGAAAKRVIQISGSVTTTGTGVLQFQWAQNTSSSTATFCHAGSWVALWQLA